MNAVEHLWEIGASASSESTESVDCPFRKGVSLLFRHLAELAGLLVLVEAVDHALEVAVHERGDVVHREADAVVGDAALGEVIGADLVAPVARPDLPLALALPLRVRLILPLL